MKIFISHSSRDKWIARKLSEEIKDLGCDTFLDEKDISTGQSIDEEIRSHLEESDDFLILLSPDSIKSHWVLIELGGAMILKKNIVIILLYLGANDIPQPISKFLARDINESGKYYDEIKKRLSGKTIKTVKSASKLVQSLPIQLNFNVGDRARIIAEPQYRTKNPAGWNTLGKMDKYCGQEVTIADIDKVDNTAKIHEDGGAFWWAFEWLSKIN